MRLQVLDELASEPEIKKPPIGGFFCLCNHLETALNDGEAFVTDGKRSNTLAAGVKDGVANGRRQRWQSGLASPTRTIA